MTMLEQTPPSAEPPLLEVKDLVQRYTLPRESMFKPAGQVHALNGVTAQVMAGRSLGVVGESGSGKSTFARLVMALETPSSGSVSLLGRDLHRLPATSFAAPGAISRWCFRIPMARSTRDRPLRVSSPSL